MSEKKENLLETLHEMKLDIDALKIEVSNKVDRNELIGQINMSEKGVSLDADRIRCGKLNSKNVNVINYENKEEI